MNSLANLAQEFEAVDDYLKAVREILQDGHLPDMAGLDGRVSDLCAMIQKADPDIQQRCLPRLSALLQKLDMCESELRAYREAAANKGRAQ